MFSNLTEKLDTVFKSLKSRGKLNEANIQDALRQVRLALLEADVNFKVVKQFIDSVRQRALGMEVMKSLTPGQQVVKIVHEELINLMGTSAETIGISEKPPTIIMLMGLQGSGKTTAAAKLANRFKGEKASPMLVAADIYRPGAVDQLKTLGNQLNIPVFDKGTSTPPPEICRLALKEAQNSGIDYLILDTAGRLHIDEALMDELVEIKRQVDPDEVLFVADAMTGQDAVNVAVQYNDKVGIDGVILTKLDGDARGGAALSIRAVTGKPVKFVGVGEKLDALQLFHPERMASRILGMGDVMTLIEQAQSSITEEKAKDLEQKLRTNTFTLEDFREQIDRLNAMGPLDQILGMVPGFGNMMKKMKGFQADSGEMVRMKAIIDSMTVQERENHTIINGSRRRRIAMGSGTQVSDVNKLLKSFAMMKKMFKDFHKGSKKLRSLQDLPFRF